MFQKLLAALLALFASAAFAAVDVNKATQAELESVKGIGPSLSTKILDERKKSAFKDWPDLIERVKGMGDANSERFSGNGLTVNGSAYSATAHPAAKESKKDAKKDTTKDAKKADAKSDVKADAKK